MALTTRVEFVKRRTNDPDAIDHWPNDVPQFQHEVDIKNIPQVPVSVAFQATNALGVTLHGSSDPMNVNVGIVQKQPIPVCIKLCEPICARSNYTIGLDLLCIPLFKVNVQGLTKLYNCASEVTPTPKPTTEPRADSATISGC
jgi:hypothetical protein